MSRRKHRAARCGWCTDMGSQAPVATHRVKLHSWDSVVFHGEYGPRLHVECMCEAHAANHRAMIQPDGPSWRLRVYRFRRTR